MPVTLQSVFNACASDTTSPATAEPLVVFLAGSLTVDSKNGKLVLVYFKPYLPSVTSFEDVALHIHTKPYEGHSGINVRARSDATGVVGSGIGRMAHGESVSLEDVKYPFYFKLKKEALHYMKSQMLAAVNSKQVSVSPQLSNALGKKASEKDRLDHVWGQPQFWDQKKGFSTQVVALSTAAAAAKQKNEAASSIASVETTASLSAVSNTGQVLHPNPVINSVLLASGAFDD